jgi:phenylpropionate dioxygenase-like ring-hydroxylating dioxygenase large terminal subunit
MSHELLELEKTELFRRTWQCIGHVSNIANPGDYMAMDVVGERAMIIRGKDAKVRAFHNVCRHRGSRVVAEQSGTCKSAIVCPFHGWSFNLDGTLRAVPLPKSFPSLDPERHGLTPLEFEIWRGFIFVRFQPGLQPSLNELMAPFEEDFEGYQLESIEPIRPISTESVHANWKSVRDVDNEGYHVAMAHPGLQDLYGGHYMDSSIAFGVSRSQGTFNADSGKLWSVRHYRKLLPRNERLPEVKQRSWLYYGLFPNLVFMLYPDCVGFYQEFPVAVDKTVQRFAYYGTPDNRREMKLARYLSSRIDRDTGREDSQLIEWSFEAVKSSAFSGIFLSDAEAGVRDYHDFLRRMLPVVEMANPPDQGTLRTVNENLKAQRNSYSWS